MSAPIPPDTQYATSTNVPVVPPRPSLSISAFTSFPIWLPPIVYLLLAALFLWRSLFAGDVFLPANLLTHIAPWSAQVSPEITLPLWNPLRWDGIAQFYPWRLFAAETLRTGTLPLWNPYQFCGTPFVANSQSAVFYPPNLLFALLPVMRAFALNALLHLTLCGWFTYLLLRRLRCVPIAALLGGVIYAFSAWQIAWLQLPTFLATSCWFPLLFLAIHRAFDSLTTQGREKREEKKRSREEETEKIENRKSKIENPNTQHPAPEYPTTRIPEHPNILFFPLPCIVGLMLLAGHLQIAFYGLLAGTLWTLALCIARGREYGWEIAGRGLGICAIALIFGLMLSAPQMLPAIELSRMSHRVGKPTAEGYQAYTEYALPSSGLVTLTLPDFFGNDYDTNNPYWGFYVKRIGEEAISLRHNAAETANYVGIVTMLLALLALIRSAQDRRRAVWFFGGLTLMTLLMAFGTAINALFYFGVPGFGQSGSPARCLVLWALSLAALAAFGLDSLLRKPPTKREVSMVFGLFALLFAAGLSFGARAVANPPPGGMPIPILRAVFGRIGEDWIRLAIMASGGLLLFVVRGRAHIFAATQAPGPSARLAAYAALLLIIGDLFWTGIRINPTARPETVYPETDGIRYVRDNLGHERIFPVNQRWSLYLPPPAIFPPNAAMVYRFRDVQGYDSLLTGQYKLFANEFARPNALGARDASPPEVGNMVFFQNPNAPQVPALGASLALTLPPTSQQFDPGAAPSGERVRDTGDMAIYALPNLLPRARLVVDSSGDALQGQVAWQEDNPTRLTLETDAPAEVRLELADQYYPGWKAFVDGKPVAIERSPKTPVFRSVPVPAGRHTVTFRYEPISFRLGFYLACVSLGLLTSSALCPRVAPVSIRRNEFLERL